uniref:Major facilitator superfamily (MFS) profile domain-containing protein n=2 Tax=Brassica oleracea var. oleracea TaxID=109376 RepID=A0A0D3ATS5_BRAOL
MSGNNQLGVLKALDVAKTQLYHFTAIIIAGMGFFTDAYDLFSIALVTKLLGRIYYHKVGAEKPGTLPPEVAAAVNGVALCGTLMGQLFFGWLGDKLGRKKVYGITLIMMVVCSVASGLSFGNNSKGVMTTLCFFRFWLGVGIGGDYPLSATIMSEYANKKTRGGFIAAVFAMQGFGILAGGIVALVLSSIFDYQFPSPIYSVDPYASTVPQADYLWRIILMIGALPAAMTYYWRMKMPETARYTALVSRNIKLAAQDMSKVLQVDLKADKEIAENKATDPKLNYGLFSKEFLKRHGLPLLGTTSTWFLLDIAFYSQNLFEKDIFSAIGWIPKAATMNAMHEVYKIARAQTLISLFSTIPGYWFTVLFIDIMGRFAIQIMGFFFMTVFMFALALPYDHWIKPDNRIGFIIIFSLTFFFANFGPNVTTFVVPAEIFPARLRSTCHGISAAAGKAGAIVGAFGFLYAAQSKDKNKTDAGYPPGIGVKNSLIMLGVINFVGMLMTFLVPESKGKSLEELSGENVNDETASSKASLSRRN